MMTSSRAIVFDLDDTLYPEREYAFSGFAAVAAAFEEVLGDPRASAAQMQKLFDTKHRPRVFNTILTQFGKPDDPHVVARMIDVYRNHAPSIHLYPDADGALSHLCGRCKLGLITDGPPVSQWAKIDALHLRTRLDAIIVTGEWGPQFTKPHSSAFELVAERLGADHHACAYIADNPAKDFLAPNALGWMTIHVRRPGGVYQHVVTPPGGRPDRIVDTLSALRELFLGSAESSVETQND